MKQAEISVRIALGRGDVSDTVYTCDFSHEYVTINADYRSCWVMAEPAKNSALPDGFRATTAGELASSPSRSTHPTSPP
ncbi:hypothetical protein G6F65_019250 [Rhizopus arrhizus]|nr:hypothetical protein G6F65_019250 [Rhizopus arrhizus]